MLSLWHVRKNKKVIMPLFAKKRAINIAEKEGKAKH